MNFSERTHWNLAENELTAAIRQRRASGLGSSTSRSPIQPIVDSTTTLPHYSTLCSIPGFSTTSPIRSA